MARIRLSEHFTYGKLLRFVMPSIMMMIFTSIYSVVDGLFVSNFVGKTPFAAINLIAPVTMVLSAFGFMAGTGGTAIIGKTLGEKKTEEANRYFSLIIYTVMIGSAWRDREFIGQQFIIWKSDLSGAAVFYAASDVSEFFRCSGETDAWPWRHCDLGRNEYCDGCVIHYSL